MRWRGSKGWEDLCTCSPPNEAIWHTVPYPIADAKPSVATYKPRVELRGQGGEEEQGVGGNSEERESS